MNHFPTRLAALSLIVALTLLPSPATAANLAMGFKVGEVTQDSAIVWARITANAERNWDGVDVSGRAGERAVEYTPLEIGVDEIQGATPGAAGDVRFTWSVNQDFSDAHTSGWLAVDPDADFTRQFELTELAPDTQYHLKVEARPTESDEPSATLTGSFGTPAEADKWQDVRFGVITGQAYRDLDDPRGFKIYDAMREAGLDFLVPTGDTVYYDSERPRARTVELARHHWHRMYSLPKLVEFHRVVPGYWEKDDHDTLSNDSWSTLNPKWMLPMTWQDGLRIFREQVPMGESTYRTIRWGKGLQIWLVEGRDFRSPNNMPDGPGKTIWGREQMDWLKRGILASDAAFRVLISPTPIVGPDRERKNDNHANEGFAHEGNRFRNWTKEQGLKNFFVCCGDRHWQYMSIDPTTGLREFSCGPASDEHAGGTPGHNPEIQPFHLVKGGFLSVSVTREDDEPKAAFRFHGVDGAVAYEFVAGR